MIVRCIYMKKKLDFPLLPYLSKVIVPIVLVTILALPIPLALSHFITDFWLNMIIVGVATFAITVLDVYFVGMNAHEKAMVRKTIQNKKPLFKHKYNERNM